MSSAVIRGATGNWSIERQGALPLQVRLWKAKTVDAFPSRRARAKPHVQGKQVAPNWQQVADLSTPLHGLDANGEFAVQVHENLNKKLVKAMDGVTEYARSATWERYSAVMEPLAEGKSSMAKVKTEVVKLGDKLKLEP